MALRRAICTGWGRCSYSTASSKSRALVFEHHGRPSQTLRLVTEHSVGEPGKNEALIRMVAAPVSETDLDSVLGAGPQDRAAFPRVGGSEGVGVVEKVGSGCSLAVGDHVVPTVSGLGTWRNRLVVSGDSVIPVDKAVPVDYAAAMGSAPCTALRLLNDFENLQQGDVVIQTGANSQVGQTVVQLAHMRGLKTINIIRDRDAAEQADTIERMKYYGGYLVVPESYVRTAEFRKMIADLPAPKLALNGTCGIAATEMARLVGRGGTMVTYGNSSRTHLQLPARVFLHNDLRLRGFNLAQWVAEHSKEEVRDMVKEVSDLVVAEKVRFWIETHRLTDWEEALQAADSQGNRKVVLHLDK
mmetsp:Transcript_19925/g.55983  ORF Transcript_19925/g.55983 Transcript_19925/m.55983 type:complete len:357 (-) Transcript_19925:29-1099(-)|eukprot:CAMPEP_0119132004 /NCGR_PEP_ID=MMETSP1310-20130426/11136_1 /TAXON_ID=464262 /ORGANISM="Genus nov. species nov., Strain RCC2339" /LENGTH=356 /DNA_ID=CAMNT_0007122609 /DNA_START=144 /DNA_END=1214 /DNA_ORIENTATION=-